MSIAVEHDRAACGLCSHTDREGWWGNSRVIHCDGCGASWTGASKAHCTTCHRTFGGAGTADRAHRYPASGIVCRDPETVGLVLDGEVWRRPPPPQAGPR